jgi:hypothetical protein
MRTKGLLLVVLLASVIVYWLLFAKAGKKTYLETVVDRGLQAQVDLTNVNLQSLQRIVAGFVSGEGRTPRSLQEVRNAGLLIAGSVDGWGHPIRYERVSDSTFRLISAGKDGRFATNDDIVLEY